MQTTSPEDIDFVYFSYVTLTTVGYGDFTAATSTGRMIAVSEALTGQLYLVSAVALLVGNIGRTIVRERPATGVEIEPLTDAEEDEEDRAPSADRAALARASGTTVRDARRGGCASSSASAAPHGPAMPGTTPSSSTSSEKLRNVRTRTIKPEGERTLDGLVDGDREHDVGHDQDLEADQDRPSDVDPQSLVGESRRAPYTGGHRGRTARTRATEEPDHQDSRRQGSRSP